LREPAFLEAFFEPAFFGRPTGRLHITTTASVGLTDTALRGDREREAVRFFEPAFRGRPGPRLVDPFFEPAFLEPVLGGRPTFFVRVDDGILIKLFYFFLKDFSDGIIKFL
jgi:hypothetical protein